MADKKVKLNLVGIDGNIFAIIGAFSRAARKQGWTSEEINKVSEEVMNSDNYDKALQVILKNTEQE